MARVPGERIFGIETEFGCLVAEDKVGTPEQIVEKVKDHVFYDLKLGLIDQHARDEVFEPARSGGFLLNGGRLYIDAVGSHLEYATAESRTLKDLIANDRAGQRLIVQALRELRLNEFVSFYNNSVDHFGGHTFGCHENYLVKIDEDFFSHQAPRLYPFLVTRQIFAGVGRVGGHLLIGGGRPSYQEVMDNPIDYIWVSHIYNVLPDPNVNYQLSQRADHILKTVASRVRFNRALINPKWEHFYSYDGMQRLHLLFGESNQNEYAFALKVGTTALVLRLLEEKRVPERLTLAEPLIALRAISRDPGYAWGVILSDGTQVGAIELQREYLSLAQSYLGESEEVDWVLREWEEILNGLEKDPMALGDRLDWVAKLQIIEEYRRQESLDWASEALHSIDLEYHNIDPEKSLFGALQEMDRVRPFLGATDVIEAMTKPPQNTRAKGRSQLIEQVLKNKVHRFYVFDWNGASLDRHEFIEMSDPFETYAGSKK